MVEEDGAPRLRVDAAEPSRTREDGRVPDMAAWTNAADVGAGRQRAAGDRPAAPPWVPASARIPAALLAQIIDWSLAGRPNEACGLLAGPATAEEGGVPTRFVGVRNAAASPFRYLIDPDEQLRVMLEIDDADEVVWGIVHSHVASPPQPSATDIGVAAYPDAVYIICSLATDPPVVRGWAIRDGNVTEVVIERV